MSLTLTTMQRQCIITRNAQNFALSFLSIRISTRVVNKPYWSSECNIMLTVLLCAPNVGGGGGGWGGHIIFAFSGVTLGFQTF